MLIVPLQRYWENVDEFVLREYIIDVVSAIPHLLVDRTRFTDQMSILGIRSDTAQRRALVILESLKKEMESLQQRHDDRHQRVDDRVMERNKRVKTDTEYDSDTDSDSDSNSDSDSDSNSDSDSDSDSESEQSDSSLDYDDKVALKQKGLSIEHQQDSPPKLASQRKRKNDRKKGLFYCAAPDCSGSIRIKSHRKRREKMTFKCPECGARNCIDCQVLKL